VLDQPAEVTALRAVHYGAAAPASGPRDPNPRGHAIALLDRLHLAQNEFYSGGSERRLRQILAPEIVWTVCTASAASTASVRMGSCSATACTAGGALGGRWAIMTGLGSTAITVHEGS
jgi:hypothetical protein